jgi:hypothetical protein
MLYFSRQQTLDDLDTTSQEKHNHVDVNPTFGDAPSDKRNPIRQISILGERNSGTRWTFEYVSFAAVMPQLVSFRLLIASLQSHAGMLRSRLDGEKGTGSL